MSSALLPQRFVCRAPPGLHQMFMNPGNFQGISNLTLYLIYRGRLLSCFCPCLDDKSCSLFRTAQLLLDPYATGRESDLLGPEYGATSNNLVNLSHVQRCVNNIPT